MLYRPTRLSTFRLRAGLFVRGIAGSLAGFARHRTDAAYLDGLNEYGLRDLGLRRIETRDFRRYY